jgi:type IV pilus assembly protein PilM
MAKNCIGLDIGSSSVKVVQIKETSKGLQLVNFGFEPLPAQTIVDGAIMNQGAVVEAIRTLRDNLGIKGKEVATAISGHSVIIKKIKVPPMTPEELEEQIPWEAEHHIPFSKDDVEIDHQLVTSEAAGDGQMELLLVAAKKEVVADYSMVIREAKLVPMVMDVAAFTIQNAFEANYPVVPEEAIAIINIGATLSNINIIAGGSSAFTRDVTVGGNAFTEEIQKRLNVSQEEAEAWKIGSAGEGASEVVPQEVEAVISSVADGVALPRFLSGLQHRRDHLEDLSLRRFGQGAGLAEGARGEGAHRCRSDGSLPQGRGGRAQVRRGFCSTTLGGGGGGGGSFTA